MDAQERVLRLSLSQRHGEIGRLLGAMQRMGRGLPLLQALQERVAQRPRIAAYLASPRRLPFNENGIFRHYPELDDPA